MNRTASASRVLLKLTFNLGINKKVCDVTCDCSSDVCELLILAYPGFKSIGWKICDIKVSGNVSSATDDATGNSDTTTVASTTDKSTTTVSTTSTVTTTTSTTTSTTTTASPGKYLKPRPIKQSW